MTHQYMEIKIKELEKRIEALEQAPLLGPYKVESKMKLTCTNKSCSNCKYWLLDKDDENRKCKYCFEMDEWVVEREG